MNVFVSYGHGPSHAAMPRLLHDSLAPCQPCLHARTRARAYMHARVRHTRAHSHTHTHTHTHSHTHSRMHMSRTHASTLTPYTPNMGHGVAAHQRVDAWRGVVHNVEGGMLNHWAHAPEKRGQHHVCPSAPGAHTDRPTRRCQSATQVCERALKLLRHLPHALRDVRRCSMKLI